MNNVGEKHLKLGTIIPNGRYEYVVEKVLGEGGFGITYKVFADVKTGNITHRNYYAIKEYFLSDSCERENITNCMICSNPVKDKVEAGMRDFVSEARRLSKLAHPNVVKVNEVFEANNTAYYVMEYLEGGNLWKYIKDFGPMSPAEMLDVMNPIIDAVAYLHSNRITHLDIKPLNIMLKTNQQSTEIRPVLIDFGLSKHYDPHGNATSTMRLGGFSPGFSPLEQYVGITTYSPQSDVYSLAATMLYCLSAELPLIASEMSKKGVLDDTMNRFVKNSQLRLILTKAMQSNADERMSTAGDLAQMLRGVNPLMLQNDSTQFVDVTSPNPTSIVPSEEPLGVRAESPQMHHNNNSPATDNPYQQPPQYPPQRHQNRSAKSAIKVWIAILSVVIVVLAGVVIYFLLNKPTNTNDSKEESYTQTHEAAIENEERAEDKPVSLSNPHWASGMSEPQKSVIKNLLGEMVSVNGGTFSMGKKGTTKSVGSFHISKYEITQSQWQAVMNTSVQDQYNKYKHYKAGRDKPQRRGIGNNYPMYYVSQNEAKQFCEKLSQLTGLKFALPTEAQWEYAAKGGNNSSYMYSGSDNLSAVAWHKGNSKKTSPVGLKSPNGLGLYDMSGNVWEWCRENSVLKGGCFLHNETNCNVNWRWTEPQSNIGWDRGGFRIVME